MFIPDPDLGFLPSGIPDPGLKKSPDTGSGSAILAPALTPDPDPSIMKQTTKKNLDLYSLAIS